MFYLNILFKYKFINMSNEHQNTFCIVKHIYFLTKMYRNKIENSMCNLQGKILCQVVYVLKNIKLITFIFRIIVVLFNSYVQIPSFMKYEIKKIRQRSKMKKVPFFHMSRKNKGS